MAREARNRAERDIEIAILMSNDESRKNAEIRAKIDAVRLSNSIEFRMWFSAFISHPRSNRS